MKGQRFCFSSVDWRARSLLSLGIFCFLRLLHCCWVCSHLMVVADEIRATDCLSLHFYWRRHRSLLQSYFSVDSFVVAVFVLLCCDECWWSRRCRRLFVISSLPVALKWLSENSLSNSLTQNTFLLSFIFFSVSSKLGIHHIVATMKIFILFFLLSLVFLFYSLCVFFYFRFIVIDRHIFQRHSSCYSLRPTAHFYCAIEIYKIKSFPFSDQCRRS